MMNVRHNAGNKQNLVQTCASVPLRNFEYLLLKKYDEERFDIVALGFKEM